MYSKIAGDMRMPNIERHRRASLRMDRFIALVKLDVQFMALLVTVGIINGINPGGSGDLPSLLVSSTVGIAAVAVWLLVCVIAVTYGRPRLALGAEFAHPCSYIVAASYMFSSVYYGERLVQIHGQAYLLGFPVIFLIGRTGVWWDARLLSGSDLAIMHRDLYGKLPEPLNKRKNEMNWNSRMLDEESKALAAGEKARSAALHGDAKVPSALKPLVRGDWILKLPSNDSMSGYLSASSKPFKKLIRAVVGRSGGRWRFFQLSHDGSTLRWDWRKYILLMHVESVHANPKDLTITLSLTLEPDLRLKCPDEETHQRWARGLTLVVMLLGNPDGLAGKEYTLDHSVREPGSPPRLLNRLTSASWRVSAAGLLSKEALQYAADRARKAFSGQSDSSSSEKCEGHPDSVTSKLASENYDWCLRRRPSSGFQGTPVSDDKVTKATNNISTRYSERTISPQNIGTVLSTNGSYTREDMNMYNDIESGHLQKRIRELQYFSPAISPQASSLASSGNTSADRTVQIDSLFQNKEGIVETRSHSFSKFQSPLRRGSRMDQLDGSGGMLRQQRAFSPLRKAGGLGAADKDFVADGHSNRLTPHSEAWHTKFDAGMTPGDKSSTDGSPSIVATPHSVISASRTMSVNVELIDFSQISFGRMLGHGAEGPVYAAWFHETPVAVKQVSSQSEIDIHLHAGWHDNVVNLRGLATNGGRSYLVMELCPRYVSYDGFVPQSLSSEATIDLCPVCVEVHLTC